MSIKAWKKILFNLYLNLPGSRYLFQGLKKIYIPPNNVRKYLRFKGVFKLNLDENIQLAIMNYGNTIENELFWLGPRGWEPYSTKAWIRLSEKSNVIFDIGANTGLYSLISSKVNPSAAVYAFEPIEFIFDRLNQNLRLNGFNVNANKTALADEDGAGEIFAADTISSTFDQASLNKKNFKTTETQSIRIKKQRVASFIEEHRISNIDLMKIDVETYEPQVLQGMGAYLEMFKPTILIEILNESVGREVESIVRNIGYHFFLIDEKKGYIKKDNLLPTRKGNNFLLLNKNKHRNTDWI
jgi:FkbM family methyltransferase